jgi:PIN domain nuclease of toxin-antitoxin system
MTLLLDACSFLWMALGSPELSSTAREHIEDPGNDLFLSVVSAWEITVKYGLGKLRLPRPSEVLIPELRRDYGVGSLELDEEAVLHLRRLPALHKDPFDRMLITQALVHGITILTPDPLIRQYPVRTLW